VKSNKTQLNQHDEDTSAGSDGTENVVLGLTEAQQNETPLRPFAQLLPQDQQHLIQIIPAELVTLHAIDLPVRSARQRLAALPFALEEVVGSQIEQTHFALCGANSDGKILAAAVADSDVARRISDAPDCVLLAEQMLIAPGVSADTGRHNWRTFRDGDRVLVRVSDGTGFAAHSDMLPALWQSAGQPAIENFGPALPEGIDRVDLSQNSLPPIPSLALYDLRQGKYQPARGLVRPLKWLAASIAISLFGHLAIAAADARAQRGIADVLRAQATRALAASLPEASVETAPELILRQLAARNQPQRGSSFLPLMDRVSQALLDQGDTVQFRQLNWAEDSLRLTVEAAGLDALQQTEARLKAAGLRVTSGSATADGGAARAELTVRP
jgi:general secretion pathway protein L